MKSILNCLLVGLSVLVAAAAALAGLELYYSLRSSASSPEAGLLVADRRLGWDSQPAFQAVDPDSRGPVIYFIGDSFVHFKRWPGHALARAQRLGKGFRGYSFGVSGYGTLQSLLKLQQHYDRFSPRLVVLLFFAWNDMRDNTGHPSLYYNPQTVRRPVLLGNQPEYSVGYTIPLFVSSSRVFEHLLFPTLCRASDFINHRFGVDLAARLGLPLIVGYTDSMTWKIFYSPSAQNSRYVQEAWQATEQTLVEMKRFLESRGTQLLVIGIDNAFTVDRDVYDAHLDSSGDTDIRMPLGRLEELLKRQNIPFVNGLPALERLAADTGRKVYLGPPGNLCRDI